MVFFLVPRALDIARTSLEKKIHEIPNEFGWGATVQCFIYLALGDQHTISRNQPNQENVKEIKQSRQLCNTELYSYMYLGYTTFCFTLDLHVLTT